ASRASGRRCRRDTRYRRRRCRRRSPTPARTASLAGRALSRSYFPVAPVIILVFVLFLEFVVVEIVVVRLFLVVLFVVLVVGLGGQVEFERRQTGDLEVRATLGTADLVAFVDVKLVDFDFGVALGAGGHKSSTRSVRRSVWQRDGRRARIRPADATAIR